MEKRFVKKLLSVLMIIMILSADFYVLASSLSTYSLKTVNSDTSNANIKFSTYFKNDSEEKTENVEKSLKEDLKLYAEIKVKNEGVFKGNIEVLNSNFNIKEATTSEKYKNKIESINGNKVNLKQIASGETVELELSIEPIVENKITTEFLSKISNVKLTGVYTYSEAAGGENIEELKEVCVNYKVDENAKAELETDIITNKIFELNGANKRLVQVLVKSRLTENQYPIQQTILKVDVPQLSEKDPEQIEVLSLGTNATNGLEKINSNEYKNENGILEIEIKNEPDTNNEITWNKNAYDEIIVSFIYPEEVDATEIEANANSEIKLYNSGNTYTAKKEKGIKNQELNNVIFTRSEINTTEIYKGQLYANVTAEKKQDVQYETTTKLVITNKDVAEEIKIEEGNDTFTTSGEKELSVNTKYISTEINKEKMLEILGQEGSLTITNGTTTVNVNKDSNADENGNIVIEYENSKGELNVLTTKPVKAGIIELKNKKAIGENNYARAELKDVKTLNAKSSAKVENIVEKATEANVELKETITKANLTVNKTSLTTNMENTGVIIGLELITSDEKYDLYKDAIINVQLPQAVKSVVHKEELVNDKEKEFKVTSIYDETTKTIQITLKGEQKEYPLEQLYLQLDLDITLDEFATSNTDEIKVTYQNENATQYFGGSTDKGVLTKQIEISAPTGVTAIYNLASNANTSIEENITQEITSSDAGKELIYEAKIINNADSDINDVKILGKLPTTDVEGNTLETNLQSITVEKGTIYYTENANADTNTEKAENGWTTELATISNAKMYLIKIDSLEKTERFNITIKTKISNTLKATTYSNTYYEITYSSLAGTNTKQSRQIKLFANVTQNVNIDLSATVGQETLKTGDTVKSGEVIKYIAKVTNNTNKTLENIEIKGKVPEGTVIVEKIDNYVYELNKYYEEKPEKTEATTVISSLGAKQTYIYEYEVRVKQDIKTGTEIENNVIAIHNNVETESFVIANKLEQANIRVTIKRADDESIPLIPGSTVNYSMFVENMSDEVIRNVKLEIISEDMIIQQISYNSGVSKSVNTLVIDEIKANEVIPYDINAILNNNINSSAISVNIIDANNKTYRSNVVKEVLPQAKAEINLSSPQNNLYINEGENIEYNITVRNVGQYSGYFKVEDIISQYIEPQEIYLNGTLKEKATDNYKICTPVTNIINLNVGESATIKIIAKVKEIAPKNDAQVVTNYATVSILDIEQAVSEKMTHILKIADKTENEIKNIVSGTVWLDKNQDGRRDNKENKLENISVKLYDISKRGYLTNENYNAITKLTDGNGDYTFTNVPNGSYMVIFEYNSDKYEATTYLAEGVENTVNSKATKQQILINGNNTIKTGTETITIQDNVYNIDLGLKEKNSTADLTKKSVSGFVWADTDNDGKKDIEETVLTGIKVRLLNNGNIKETVTDERGQYNFTNLEKGLYTIIFEYDTDVYEPTLYYATNVESELNSKAITTTMEIDGITKTVATTGSMDIQENIIDMNLGLKEIVKEVPPEVNPENPVDPVDPSDPTNPSDPSNPSNPSDSEEKEETKIITGFAWYDENGNGQKDAEEKMLSGIKVKLYNVETKKYETDKEGKQKEVETDENGKYAFNEIAKGTYIVIFEYDTEKYEVTKYLAEGVGTTVNSKVVEKNIQIEGKEEKATVTDIIELKENVFNINIGLKEKLKFDLELSKTISRVVVQTKQNTKEYKFEESNFEKVEIHRKQIDGALVVIEYTIKVKNTGELAGKVQNIVDYMPNGLTFNSELNSDWYISGGEIYTKSLDKEEIQPGEEKEVKLILTKTMTGDNVGWINNRAEIYQDYNKYGNPDIDSTPNNQVESEDDMGTADIIIGISTGGSIIGYIILLIINTILIGIAIKLMIRNRIIRIPNRKVRR